METLKISAKNLGYTALADFCPRCYYLRLKMNFKLPFASFPGIFSSIDSYTKSCCHKIIDNANLLGGKLPSWMSDEMGDIVGYEKVLHWSKNTHFDPKTNITMHGAMDDILVRRDGSRIVVDWKTAKYSETQDRLRPMYDVQLGVYSVLAEKDKPPVDLYLIYMEPCTEPSYADDNIIDCGFRMCFSGKVVKVERDRMVVRKALNISREIYDLPTAPKGAEGCKECASLDKLIGLLGMGKVSNAGLEE